MNEDFLRNDLLRNLQKGWVKKIAPLRSGQKVKFGKEIGNNSFRTDILLTFAVKNHNKDLCKRFVAIEVKIKDWKQGLYQAVQYKTFAERSYLALYEDYAEGVDLGMFQKYNVGLIIFNKDEISVKYTPHNDRTYMKDYSTELRSYLWDKLTLEKSV